MVYYLVRRYVEEQGSKEREKNHSTAWRKGYATEYIRMLLTS
jgi:hypothetical protein